MVGNMVTEKGVKRARKCVVRAGIQCDNMNHMRKNV